MLHLKKYIFLSAFLTRLPNIYFGVAQTHFFWSFQRSLKRCCIKCEKYGLVDFLRYTRWNIYPISVTFFKNWCLKNIPNGFFKLFCKYGSFWSWSRIFFDIVWVFREMVEVLFTNSFSSYVSINCGLYSEPRKICSNELVLFWAFFQFWAALSNHFCLSYRLLAKYIHKFYYFLDQNRSGLSNVNSNCHQCDKHLF